MEATIGQVEVEAMTGHLEPGKPSTPHLVDHHTDVVPDILYFLFDDDDHARRSLLLTPKQLEENYLVRLAMDAEYDGDDEACGICDDDDDEDMATRQRWVFHRFWANDGRSLWFSCQSISYVLIRMTTNYSCVNDPCTYCYVCVPSFFLQIKPLVHGSYIACVHVLQNRTV